MKSLNQLELESLVEWLRPQIEGAQLQEVYSHERGLVLGLYLRKNFWLILDLQNQSPFIALIQDEKCPWPKTRMTKPAGLFLNSHGKNLYLTNIVVHSELGRVVKISFQNKNMICDIEICAIPRRANLKVSADEKSISWLPWKELDQKNESSPEEVLEFRSAPELLREWSESFREIKQSGKGQGKEGGHLVENLKKDLRKKMKATEEISKKIISNEEEAEILYNLGEELKLKPLELFKENAHAILLDFKRSASVNREKCFEKAKANLKKNHGAKERLLKLKQEILDLEEKISKLESGDLSTENFSLQNQQFNLKSKAKHKISNADDSVRARKKVLDSGVVVYMGKSAKDNLALLRKARAWDYWLHLRDYPGAHAIIHREKNQNINQKELQEISCWLAEESFGAKGLQAGSRLEVVMAEVRFVRPIKGDTTGKVNYHSERKLSFVYGKI